MFVCYLNTYLIALNCFRVYQFSSICFNRYVYLGLFDSEIEAARYVYECFVVFVDLFRLPDYELQLVYPIVLELMIKLQSSVMGKKLLQTLIPAYMRMSWVQLVIYLELFGGSSPFIFLFFFFWISPLIDSHELLKNHHQPKSWNRILIWGWAIQAQKNTPFHLGIIAQMSPQILICKSLMNLTLRWKWI